MKTLTAMQARRSLGAWLNRAVRGEDIGIIDSGSGKVVALRPVEVYSDDYALIEYGLTGREMKRVVRNLNKLAKREKTIPWDGTVQGLRG